MTDEEKPWHPSHCPEAEDPAEWSLRCRAWCEAIQTDDKYKRYSIRTHLHCERCGFSFLYRTTNYSMRSSADVKNFGVCANPCCKHEWSEWG